MALAEGGLDLKVDRGGSGPRAATHAHSHEGGNHGMLTDDQVDAMAALEGSEFDIALLSALVEHHYGGLQPADEEIAGGEDAEAIALAQSEADDIRVEVQDVRDVLAAIGGPGSTTADAS